MKGSFSSNLRIVCVEPKLFLSFVDDDAYTNKLTEHVLIGYFPHLGGQVPRWMM